MKYLKLLMLMLILMSIGCSTTSFKQAQQRQLLINEHLAQGVQLIDGEFDSKYLTSGSDGISLRKIGIAIYPIGYNEQVIRSAAIADGKFSLIDGAPTEMKSIVQKAIGNAIGYVGEYSQIQTSVTEVRALKGIEASQSNVQCRTQVTPTAEGEYKTERVCRAIVKVSLTELTKAFDFTMASKYKIKKKSAVQEILNQQLKSNLASKQ